MLQRRHLPPVLCCVYCCANGLGCGLSATGGDGEEGLKQHPSCTYLHPASPYHHDVGEESSWPVSRYCIVRPPLLMRCCWDGHGMGFFSASCQFLPHTLIFIGSLSQWRCRKINANRAHVDTHHCVAHQQSTSTIYATIHWVGKKLMAWGQQVIMGMRDRLQLRFGGHGGLDNRHKKESITVGPIFRIACWGLEAALRIEIEVSLQCIILHLQHTTTLCLCVPAKHWINTKPDKSSPVTVAGGQYVINNAMSYDDASSQPPML